MKNGVFKKLLYITRGTGVSKDEFIKIIDLMEDYAKYYHKAQLVTNQRICPCCGDTLMKQVASSNFNCVNCGLTVRL